jgi:hypothetical protein
MPSFQCREEKDNIIFSFLNSFSFTFFLLSVLRNLLKYGNKVLCKPLHFPSILLLSSCYLLFRTFSSFLLNNKQFFAVFPFKFTQYFLFLGTTVLFTPISAFFQLIFGFFNVLNHCFRFIELLCQHLMQLKTCSFSIYIYSNFQ